MRLRVILVEGDDLLRRSLCKLLRHLGYEVLAASRPGLCPVYSRSACDCPRGWVCGDVLLVDYRLPEMNGVELIELQLAAGCKGLVRNKAVMTSGLRCGDLVRAELLGAKVFEKPFDTEELVEWLERCRARVGPGRKLREFETGTCRNGRSCLG